ncbi:MAG: ABC transporter permease [Actinomycetota bacterium]
MATFRFLLKRSVAQRLLGLAVVVTLAFSIGVLVAGPIYADAAREAILSSALRDEDVTVTNARIQVYGGPDFDWAAADAAIVEATAGLPVGTIVDQGVSTVRLGGEDGPSVPLLFRDGAEDHLEFRGEPPGAGQAALPVGAAPGVRIGDAIDLVGPADDVVTLEVSGLFEDPPRDRFWFGGRSPFPPPDSTQPSPVLVSRDTSLQTAEELGLTTEYAWDVYLDLAGVPFGTVRTIPGQLRQIESQLSAEPELSQVRVASGLGTLMAVVEQRVQNLRVPILLVVFQIGAVTLAVLAGVGALTLTRQAFELSVLHSRGFSSRKLLLAQTFQAGVAALVAYPLGLLIGIALAKLAGHSNGARLPGVLFPVDLSGPAQVLGLVAAAAGALILVLLSIPLVRRTVLEERRAASREDRPLLARLPIELIVLPVGIFAFIQLRGGTKPEPGSGTIDPLVLLAPTLLLFAASFLALRFLLFVFRRSDRRIGRTRRLPLYLAGRRLGRAPGTGFAAALLLLLAMGLLVVSTSYRAIVLRNHEDSAHNQIGADWRVNVTPPADVLGAFGTMPPNTTPVVRAEPSLEGGSFSLPPPAYGIDPATYARGGWWRSDFSAMPLPEILAALETEPIGYEVPPGASVLHVELEASEAESRLTLTATALRTDGTVATAEPLPIEEGVAGYDLPIDGAERLLSITLYAETTLDLPFDLSVAFAEADVDGTPLPLDAWEPITWRGSEGTLEPEGAGYRYDFHPGAGNVVGGITPASPPLPALVSTNVASGQGDVIPVTLGGLHLELDRVAVATQFPSNVPNAPFVVVSAPALLERELAIPEAGLTLNEAWAMGAADPRPALRERGFLTGSTVRAAPIEAILAQLPQSLAVGMNYTAAVGGLLLVVIGVAAGLYFAQRRRDYEFAALRAMGTDRRQIRRALVLEQSVLLGFAVLAGSGLGYLLLRLVMPYVGTSLGVSYPPPVLVLDWRSMLIALLAIVIATGLGLALALRALMRASVTGVLRGEAE